MQAAILLMAVTGNLDVPGGMAIWEHGPFVDPFGPEHERPDLLPDKSRQMLAVYGAREFPILGITHGSLVNEAIDKGKLPVPILFIIGHNFLLTAENTTMCHQVMHKVPFSVTFALFMTPTAALSDLFLPVTTWLERDQLTTPYTRFGQFARVKAVDPPPASAATTRTSCWSWPIGWVSTRPFPGIRWRNISTGGWLARG